MSGNYAISSEEAILQLTDTVMALAKVAAELSPDQTQGHLAVAIEGAKRGGHGHQLIEEIYKATFPNAKPTVALSPEEFAKKQRDLGQ
ncbi:hypothetical protein WCL09_17620 [Pseudomonas koreensis]|uniref:hypothetical protein n=1 Tax=Pseudomonas koreensis TaxID=198620 RepID=UPI0030185884